MLCSRLLEAPSFVSLCYLVLVPRLTSFSIWDLGLGGQALLGGLQEYFVEHHKTGLEWNNLRGTNAAEYQGV